MSKFHQIIRKRAVLLGSVALLAIVGAGVTLHGGTQAQAETPAAAAPAPAVPVMVQTMSPRNVQVWSAFSGRMRAVDFAEIRPEVSGRITAVRITDGQTVKAGDVLFVIDPAPYEAAAARAEANLASARTNATFAQTELERAANLVKNQAIAQRLYDERVNADKVAAASILVAEAELKQAKINLDHAYVKAPISGRISRAEITLGNLVQAGNGAPLLTSIVSDNGIYADFEVDEQTYMKSIRVKAASRDEERHIPVQVSVQGDEAHPYSGTIESFDNRIDTASGTIRARARFDNKDGALMPGMFVSVKVASGTAVSALLVQDRAIGNDQSKRFVYVVGDDGKVAYREVALGAQVDDQRIVLNGLNAGDRVIVDGLQHLRPNVTVSVKEAALNTPKPNLAAN
jgi:multidrug efflux system membrane fusion protein